MSKKTRLYFSEKIQSDLIAHLKKEQSHYLKDVMRLKIGENFSIFNTSGEWNAVIENYEKNSATIKILKKIRSKENETNIWLAFSPIKQNPLNFMIQKTTELGIQMFCPILCDRSSVNNLNTKRVEKIIVEACEQSNRLSIPKINKLTSFKFFFNSFPENGTLIFCDINSDNYNIEKNLLKKKKGPICILIGPEGDFSENERQLIIEKNDSFSFSLGQNILRSETAAISALSIVNSALNLRSI